MRTMSQKFLGIVLPVVLLMACQYSENPASPTDAMENEPGDADVYVSLGQVGRLAKTSAIDLKMLELVLTARGEETITDTIALQGHEEQRVNRTYKKLATDREWTLSAQTKDLNGRVIHIGESQFTIRSCQTTRVDLRLHAAYSMLVANFFPIRDSVTRCELLIDGRPAGSESFAKQSRVNDTVAIEFDYLTACPNGIEHDIELKVYGELWGEGMLLYTGETSIEAVSGVDKNYTLMLEWVGLNSPPWGQAEMAVVIGPVGTIGIDAELEDPGFIIPDCEIFNLLVNCSELSDAEVTELDEMPCDCQAETGGYVVDFGGEANNVNVSFETGATGADESCNGTGFMDYSRDGKEWKRVWIKSGMKGKTKYKEKVKIHERFRYVRINSDGCDIDMFNVKIDEPDVVCDDE